MPDTYHFAVIGNPIAHSQSPQIHRAFAEQFNIQLDYQKHLGPLDGLLPALSQLQAQGLLGTNITLPFKQQAIAYCTELTPRARIAGAVNTLKFAPQTCIGDNTDGVGLIRDLRDNLHCECHNKNILIIGAGGAVRGILAPLLEQQPKAIIITNRTAAKAQQLANEFAHLGRISATEISTLPTHAFDLIINATSASIQAELPALPEQLFNENAHAYDLMYAAQPTAFMQWAKQQAAQHVNDGLGMLVEQAAEAFYFWLGQRPQTQSVIQQLRAQLSST